MNKAEDIYHKIIESYDEHNYLAEQEGIELINQYADEVNREMVVEFELRHTRGDSRAAKKLAYIQFDEWKSKQEDK